MSPARIPALAYATHPRPSSPGGFSPVNCLYPGTWLSRFTRQAPYQAPELARQTVLHPKIRIAGAASISTENPAGPMRLPDRRPLPAHRSVL